MRSTRSSAPRVAAVWLAVATVAAAGASAQSADPVTRIYSTASRTVVNGDARAAELARADVAILSDRVNGPGSQRVAMALLQSLVGRRPDIVLAVDFVDRELQDPLEHFQMAHLSDRE